MDAEKYLLGQAAKIEAAYPKSKCLVRLAGALRAAAADLRDATDDKVQSYIIEAYSHHGLVLDERGRELAQ